MHTIIISLLYLSPVCKVNLVCRDLTRVLVYRHLFFNFTPSAKSGSRAACHPIVCESITYMLCKRVFIHARSLQWKVWQDSDKTTLQLSRLVVFDCHRCITFVEYEHCCLLYSSIVGKTVFCCELELFSKNHSQKIQYWFIQLGNTFGFSVRFQVMLCMKDSAKQILGRRTLHTRRLEKADTSGSYDSWWAIPSHAKPMELQEELDSGVLRFKSCHYQAVG